jgi:hypothetical protein
MVRSDIQKSHEEIHGRKWQVWLNHCRNANELPKIEL